MNPTFIENKLTMNCRVYELGKETMTIKDKGKKVKLDIKVNKNGRSFFEYKNDIYCHLSDYHHPLDFRKIEVE